MSVMPTSDDLADGETPWRRGLRVVPGGAASATTGREPGVWPAGIFDSLPMTICVIDLDGRVRHVNSGVRELLGHLPHDCEGVEALKFVHPIDRVRATSWFSSVAAGESAGTLHCQLLHRREDPVTVEVSAGRLERDPRRGIVCAVRMVERRGPAAAAWPVGHHLPTESDGMVSRSTFARVVNDLNQDGSGQPLVVFVDVDDYDGIYHGYGEKAAGEVVRTVRDVLGTAVRRDDVIGRIGNGSLAVLFRDVPERDVPKLVRRLSRALQRPVPTSAGRIRLSASVGAARPEGRLETSVQKCS
jgi:diguanylate cyclase (GGDEF)-like protein/PAS domain S-box-containing protein